jgi:hypothetical protein
VLGFDVCARESHRLVLLNIDDLIVRIFPVTVSNTSNLKAPDFWPVDAVWIDPQAPNALSSTDLPGVLNCRVCRAEGQRKLERLGIAPRYRERFDLAESRRVLVEPLNFLWGHYGHHRRFDLMRLRVPSTITNRTDTMALCQMYRCPCAAPAPCRFDPQVGRSD